MWNGDVTFGETWAVYVGKVADQSAHAHAALQVAIATAGKIDLALASGAIVSGESLVVAPLVRHQLLKADSQVILLYFDAHSPTARLLLASLHTASVGPPPQSFLNAVGLDPMGGATTLAKLEADGIGTSGLDPRLAAALAELGNDMSGGAIERVARTVGLSAPRLRALAKTQLGRPLSQWQPRDCGWWDIGGLGPCRGICRPGTHGPHNAPHVRNYTGWCGDTTSQAVCSTEWRPLSIC